MSLCHALKRLGVQLPQLQQAANNSPILGRRFAGFAKIKEDKSLDHVFGDNSHKLDYDFAPMPLGSMLIRSVVIVGVFFFPVWIFLAEDMKYQSFLRQLEEARAKRAASESSAA